MNKIFLSLLILATIPIFVGFTQNFEHPNDFAKRMNIIKDKNDGIKIEATSHNGEQKFTGYYKNGKFRMDEKNYYNSGENNITIIENDKVYTFIEGSKTVSANDMKNLKELIGSLYPVYKLINWDKKVNYDGFYVGESTTKNGFKCKMLKNKDAIGEPEMCISEEYGISVYENRHLTSSLKNETNVQKIETGKNIVSNDMFKLPENAIINEKNYTKNLF